MPSDPANPILDDFNRANEDPLSGGGKWDKNGSSAGALNVTSNQCAGPNNSKGAFWNVKNYGPDLEVFATFSDATIGGADFFGPMWSFSGAAGSDTWSAYWLIYYGNGGSPQIRVRTVTNPTVTDILTINQTLTDGDKLWIIQEGGVIYVYGKVGGSGSWSLLGSVADTTFYRSGKLGIRGLGSVAGAWKLDDFGGGNWAEVKVSVLFSGTDEISHAYADANTIPVLVSPSAVELAEIGTVRTVPVAVTPAFADYWPSEFVTIPVLATFSGADIQDIHDSNEIAVKVTNLSVENPQFILVETPSWYVDIQLSAVELFAKQYTDALSAYVDVRVADLECYNTATPDFGVIDSLKWGVTEQEHWDTIEAGNRWNTYEVVGDFDNSCFAVTVA